MLASRAEVLYRQGRSRKDGAVRWDGTGLPFIEPGDDFGECATVLADSYVDEFTLFPRMDPDSIEAAAIAGFMPMAARVETPRGPLAILIPKLHLRRCLLDPRLTHITRTARRESSRYAFGMNTAFHEVTDACLEVHGDDWLLPELVDAFCRLHEERATRRVAFLSAELWSGNGPDRALVAGEIGYLVGSSYASLSGFSRVSGAGTVQLAALGSLLAAKGIRVWDLGMPMEYKLSLGGRELARSRFLPLLRRAYTASADPARAALVPASMPVNARGIIN
jgi:Leu/Phe-tRNA-protein transferase